MGEQGVSTLNEENRWYVRLMKLAHDLAMDGCGQEAQDLREAATHIRNMANANKRCFRCGGRWSRGCKEMHHKGCLAAPEAGEL